MSESTLERALRDIVLALEGQRRSFALVGGLAVSVRSEVRFTRDVDIAVATTGDRDAEALVFGLRAQGYGVVALVEQDAVGTLATARLLAPAGVVVDLLFASSGLESEIVARAEPVVFGRAGALPVASATDLLTMKILAMGPHRLQDEIDAVRLLQVEGAGLDLGAVRANLRLIRERGFDRGEDLEGKLDRLLDRIGGG